MTQRDMEHLHDEEEPAPAPGEAAQVFISIICMIGMASGCVVALVELIDRFYN